MSPSPHAALTYTSYLALDEVLEAQRPRSDEHDEMLFIVIHQVYELWFKQLLHELAYLQERLEAGDTAHAIRTLRRILTVFKVVVAQIDVLETMTPRQFTGFRARLDASSGFQSGQFRELEAVLGRRDDKVFEHYPEESPYRARIAAAMARPSLYDSFVRYLAVRGYKVDTERDVREQAEPSPALQRILLDVYADDGGEATVAEHLVDLDEGLQEWRYRHVKMVERTIGAKIGTGGSPGAAYLRTTLFAPVFPDLWAVRSEL
ncbi:tryptophan 2,3-dioxygenase [Amycolatopsis sp. CA-230715]|uniref:tryptophan 2,3-dioxygenase n=1 Tax=Amycolatopsis sp. CA-230715 TaxID=2745196 RepID=UPI001C01FA1D|nr:tryptophan 2,3-dioxygenase family protein [Amycolatopsis sp. CA-230715]QWF78289.1 Tryptophan 2,3-dioxygenase [Amycolatopsis sp. CA-230715]